MTTGQMKQACHKGATTVEFAIVTALFFTLLMGFFEFGRVVLSWNAAVQATTMGARTAAVCSIGSSAPVTRMETILPGISNAVVIEYLDAAGNSTTSCNSSLNNACFQVRARLDGSRFQAGFVTPLFSAALTLPSFTTVIPAERLNSTGNPDCN